VKCQKKPYRKECCQPDRHREADGKEHPGHKLSEAQSVPRFGADAGLSHFLDFSPIRLAGGLRCGLNSSAEKVFRQLLANRFDCAAQPPFNSVMLSAIAGALILLSIGILAAHAMDVFRSWR